VGFLVRGSQTSSIKHAKQTKEHNQYETSSPREGRELPGRKHHKLLYHLDPESIFINIVTIKATNHPIPSAQSYKQTWSYRLWRKESENQNKQALTKTHFYFSSSLLLFVIPAPFRHPCSIAIGDTLVG
jgi:hypothetical protein